MHAPSGPRAAELAAAAARLVALATTADRVEADAAAQEAAKDDFTSLLEVRGAGQGARAHCAARRPFAAPAACLGLTSGGRP